MNDCRLSFSLKRAVNSFIAGTVGVFQFNESELGRASSSEELAEVMRTVYGDRQRAAGGGLLFAESIDQLPPEEEEQQQQQQQQATMQQRPLLKPLEAQQPAAQQRQEGTQADRVSVGYKHIVVCRPHALADPTLGQ